MAKGYSKDLRVRAVALVESGESAREAAAHSQPRPFDDDPMDESLEEDRKSRGVRYLPAYSPDRNSIEQAFSRLKAALRKGASRTIDALHKLVGKLFKSFCTADVCQILQACRIHEMIHILWKML